MKKKTIAAILSMFMLFAIGCGNNNGGNNNGSNGGDEEDATWKAMTEQQRTVTMLAATDDFDRTFTVTGAADDEKYVGMFFFTLHGQMPRDEIYDVTEITGGKSENVDAFSNHAEKLPEGTAYFWGKPVWDYYSSCDPWVMRKQIEMLTMAGVDFLFID
ncbi:MAG: hypothetical protein K2N18_00430, partial [Clostridia bacterium]|nr:hypothetical protein [Clostridia bacterium]